MPTLLDGELRKFFAVRAFLGGPRLAGLGVSVARGGP
jgi:hypothetical protein